MPDKDVQGVIVAINYSLNDENGNLFEYREIPVSICMAQVRSCF